MFGVPELWWWGHWSVLLWWDPNDVPHRRILPSYEAERWSVPASLCWWCCYCLADQLWVLIAYARRRRMVETICTALQCREMVLCRINENISEQHVAVWTVSVRSSVSAATRQTPERHGVRALTGLVLVLVESSDYRTFGLSIQNPLTAMSL